MNADQKTQMIRGLLELTTLVVDDKIADLDLSKRLIGASEWLKKIAQSSEKIEKPTKKGPVEPTTDEINAVYEYWKKQTKRPKAVLTATRKSRIKSRLKDGFSVKQLQSVIDYAVQSDFHQGDNDRGNRYDWTRNIMGSTEKVERNLERISQNGHTTVKPRNEKTELEELASEALKEGKINEYNAIRARIRGTQENANGDNVV